MNFDRSLDCAQELAMVFKQMRVCGRFTNIGIAANGPDIPFALIRCVEEMVLMFSYMEAGETASIHLFGSEIPYNSAMVHIIRCYISTAVRLYSSPVRVGNAAQHGTWVLGDTETPHTSTIQADVIYFVPQKLLSFTGFFTVANKYHNNKHSDHHHHSCR
jgi:hypothetical protein